MPLYSLLIAALFTADCLYLLLSASPFTAEHRVCRGCQAAQAGSGIAELEYDSPVRVRRIRNQVARMGGDATMRAIVGWMHG